MSLEDIVREIRRQEKIINSAQAEKDRLYDKLLMSGDEDFDLISVKEASRLLGVSYGTVYNKVNSGELAHRRIGSAIRVFRSEVVKIDDTMRS